MLFTYSCSSIFCDNCNLWVHQSQCSSLSLSEFETLSQPNSKSWFCPKCLNSTLPFFFPHMKNLRGLPKELHLFPLNDKLKYLLLNLNNVVSDLTDDSDISEANFKSTKCNHYEYQNLNNLSQISNCNFSLIHHKFRIIGITESRIL